ncbi:MAG: hypothetical protein ACP5KI_00775 [Brevinematia bacterium]
MEKLLLNILSVLLINFRIFGIEIEKLPWKTTYDLIINEYVINFNNASTVEKTGILISYLNLQNDNNLYSIGVARKFNNIIISSGISYLNIEGFFSDIQNQTTSLGEIMFRTQGKVKIEKELSLGIGINTIYSMFNFFEALQLLLDVSIKIITSIPSLYNGNNLTITSSLYNLGMSLNNASLTTPKFSATIEYKAIPLNKAIVSTFSDLILSEEIRNFDLRIGIAIEYEKFLKALIFYNVGSREGEIGIFNNFSFKIRKEEISLGYALVFNPYIGNIINISSYLNF